MSEKTSRKKKSKSSSKRSSSRGRSSISAETNNEQFLSAQNNNVSCVTVPIFKSFGKNLRHYYHNRNTSDKKSSKYSSTATTSTSINNTLPAVAVVRKEQRQANNATTIQQQERDNGMLLDYSPRSFNTNSCVGIARSGSDLSSKFNELKQSTNTKNNANITIPSTMTNATAATTSDSDNGTNTKPRHGRTSKVDKNGFIISSLESDAENEEKKKSTIDEGLTSSKLQQLNDKAKSISRHHSTQSIDSSGEISQATVLSTISSIIDGVAAVQTQHNGRLIRSTRSQSPTVGNKGAVKSARSFDRENNPATPTTRSSSTPHPSKLIPLNAAPSNPSILSNFSFLNNFLPKGKIETLHYLIKNKNWKEVTNLLSKDLHETEKEDSIAKSNFPCLGLACSLNAPFEVIKLILLNQPNGATFHDEKLNFPLHHICIYGTSYKALRLVLSHYPDVVSKKNVLGKTPLFVAVERGVPSKWCDLLIDTAPEVSGYPDTMGVYPLHHAVKNCEDTMFLKKLIATYPQAVKKLDKQGAAPLHYAVSYDCSYDVISLLLTFSPAMAKFKVAGVDCIKLLWALYESYPSITSPTSAIAKNEDKTQSMLQKKECWNKIELLLKANYHGTISDPLPDGKQWKVVHAAAAYGVPFKLLKLVISMYPEQVNRTDENGCYPLHLASASSLTFNKEDGRRIDLLLSVYPEAARCSDKNSRLPLHYALENGRTWYKGIEKMLESYPDAIGIPDPKTSFYPFMITAQQNEYKLQQQESEFFEQDIKDEVGNTFWSNLTLARKNVLLSQKKASESNEELETLYQLIRRNPNLVAHCAVKNAPDDMETVTLRLNNMELRRKKKSLRRALARMCADFDRVNTNHTLRTSELELEIARLTQKLSVLRIMDPVVTNSCSSSVCQSQQQTFDVASSADDYSESQGGGYSSGQTTLPLKSTLKKVKDPSKKYRRIKVSFA